MPSFKDIIKDIFFFKEPEHKEVFILNENTFDKILASEMNIKGQSDKEHTPENDGLKREEANKKNKKDRRVRKIIKPKDLGKNESAPGRQEELKVTDKKNADDKPGLKVSKNAYVNLEYMKKRYSIPINGDIILREFEVTVARKNVYVFVMFYDGMTDRKVINDNILQPLMLLSNIDIKSEEKDVIQYVRKHLLPQNQMKLTEEFQEVIDEINFGGCGIFIDGAEYAIACDVKGWEHRGVERPNTELVIRGPQEGFNEVLRVNTALIRKILKDEDLIAEDISIGKRSKTACSLLYVKDIANDGLVREVRRRLNGIKIDYLIDSGQLEQYLEDSTYLGAPQILATERPDRAAAFLAEGKVAVTMDGSPFVLVMPTTMGALLHTSEDSYVRFPYVNFIRLIRIAAVIFALLLPGLYIAITNFHHEMIPTDLLLAIEASREKVPFPSVIEILIMEMAFELIREAGIRIPGPIGPTLGIIGALILGQAAVAANIVSPILIIIVAVTGIGSFGIPNFSLAFSFRILRFLYIILGSLAGFLGITTGLFVHGLFLTSAKSFGVPFMVPFGPKTADTMNNQLTRSPIWKQERRPDYLNTKDDKKQEKISRQWTGEGEKGNNGSGNEGGS